MSNPYIGQISAFAFNYPPATWAFCNGALQSINNNQALYALIGDLYGGDGRTTFGLPNLTSRCAIGYSMGQAPGLQQFHLGQYYGFQYQSLDVRHLSQHAHTASFTPLSANASPVTLKATTDDGTSAAPSPGAYLAQPSDLPGRDKREEIFKTTPSTGSTVALGGVSGGSSADSGHISIDPNGTSQQFAAHNPFTAINFSMALLGLFPPRN